MLLAPPMALYTPLSDQQLADVLRRYGLPPSERTLPEPKGSVNTNYHLWSGGKRWFLRLNEGKTAEDVAFEADVLRFLARERFPAAPLVLASGGAAQIEVAGRPAMLFAFAEGQELERTDVTPERCRRIGAELGRLHAIAPRFERARPNPYRWWRRASPCSATSWRSPSACRPRRAGSSTATSSSTTCSGSGSASRRCSIGR